MQIATGWRGKLAKIFYGMWGSALGLAIAGNLYDQTQSCGTILFCIVTTLSVSVLLTALLIKPWSIKVAAQPTTAPLLHPYRIS